MRISALTAMSPAAAPAARCAALLLAFLSPAGALLSGGRREVGRASTHRCTGQVARAGHTENVSARIANLTLIHVPRTAGTSIEDCSLGETDDSLRWGHLTSKLEGLHLFPRARDKRRSPYRRSCYKHHVPPSQMQAYYNGKATFCVVRDPYERLISEFHYPFTAGYDKMVKSGMCNATGLNEFVFDKMNLTHYNPYICDCHMLPQSAYVYGWNQRGFKVDRRRKSCDHVLRMEHLHDDFNNLMEKFGYEYRLTSERDWRLEPLPSDNCTTVTVHDLTDEARSLVNRLWRDDFELLGYKMVKGSNDGTPFDYIH